MGTTYEEKSINHGQNEFVPISCGAGSTKESREAFADMPGSTTPANPRLSFQAGRIGAGGQWTLNSWPSIAERVAR